MNEPGEDRADPDGATTPAPEDPWPLLQNLLLCCSRVPEIAMRVSLVSELFTSASPATSFFILDQLIFLFVQRGQASILVAPMEQPSMNIY